MGNKELKKHFEQNMLDGDKVEDCGKTMLSAESVWEYIDELFSQQKKELLEQVRQLVVGISEERFAEAKDAEDLAFDRGYDKKEAQVLEALATLQKGEDV